MSGKQPGNRRPAHLGTARQPRALLAVVILTAFIIAVSQAVQHGEWSSATVLSALVLCPFISPVADAAISRASEHEADRFAAQIGYGLSLSRALRSAEASQSRCSILHDHPATDRRLRRLELLIATSMCNFAVPSALPPDGAGSGTGRGGDSV